MSDYPITTQLREIASDLRAKAREHSKTQSPVAVVLMQAMEDQAAKINDVILALEQPIQGTHVFDMIAAVEQGNVETTETLIHMVAATVLAKLIEDEGGGRSNISFSPADMDAMHRDYEMETNRDGMVTTVKIVPRDTHALIVGGPDHALNRLMAQDEDTTGALPQVEASPAKPYFFYRDGGGRQGPMEKDDAQALVLKSVDPTAHVENRMCGRVDCPNSDMQGTCAACGS